MVEMESENELEKGEPAPDFDLKNVDGEYYSLSDFQGYELLLIVFTCNHCPYAKAKIEHLNEIAIDFEGVAVIGINPNDEVEYPEDSFDKMVDWMESGKLKYDYYLRDESQDVAERYGAVCTPDPYLFKNMDGEFRLIYHGRLDDALDPESTPSRFYVRDAIEDLLAGEEVDMEFMPSRGCSIKWR